MYAAGQKSQQESFFQTFVVNFSASTVWKVLLFIWPKLVKSSSSVKYRHSWIKHVRESQVLAVCGIFKSPLGINWRDLCKMLTLIKGKYINVWMSLQGLKTDGWSSNLEKGDQRIGWVSPLLIFTLCIIEGYLSR